MPHKKMKSEVLKKIKKVNPDPKWKFILKDWVIWAAFGLSIIVGGVATSVTIFMLKTNDWDVPRKAGNSSIKFFFETLPYIWIVIFVLFIAFAHYNFRHTKKGYKFQLPAIIIINLAATLILGFALLGIGAAQNIDQFALDRVPGYEKFGHHRQIQKIWTQAENGLIGGQLTDLNEEGLKLTDFNGKEWTIIMPEDTPISTKYFRNDEFIQVIGEKINEETFQAEEIRPWPRPIRKPSIEGPPTFLKENFPGERRR